MSSKCGLGLGISTRGNHSAVGSSVLQIGAWCAAWGELCGGRAGVSMLQGMLVARFALGKVPCDQLDAACGRSLV